MPLQVQPQALQSGSHKWTRPRGDGDVCAFGARNSKFSRWILSLVSHSGLFSEESSPFYLESPRIYSIPIKLCVYVCVRMRAHMHTSVWSPEGTSGVVSRVPPTLDFEIHPLTGLKLAD